jgi:LAO/AO transport system kinase
MNTSTDVIQAMKSGDKRALARCITIVENELNGFDSILQSLEFPKTTPIIGITGPPGAGKSTLINRLIKKLTEQGKSIGILAVDPTSPFTNGSLLGDRLRMSDHFLNDQVFIRSLATRGSLGGLSAKAIEITDVIRSFGFDLIIIETVGVGQSEVEIAGLADLTILVLVPESGDDVQTLKSGIMEIADIFVVNKADRPGADIFVKNLLALVQSKTESKAPVIKTNSIKEEGVDELINAIFLLRKNENNEKRTWLLTEKAYRLIGNQRMKGISRKHLEAKLRTESSKPDFNLYNFIRQFPEA